MNKLLKMLSFIGLMLFSAMLFAGDRADMKPIVASIKTDAEKLLQTYQPDEALHYGSEFSKLYFNTFEASGMELYLGLLDNNLMLKTESDFGTLINAAMKGKDKLELNVAWQTLSADLDLAIEKQDAQSTGYTASLIQAFIIIFREGLEALLIISVLIMYLRRSGNAESVSAIYWGAGIAILLSVALAWALSTMISLSGLYRERLEGMVMLVGALFMLYVSGWLFKQRNIDWKSQLIAKADNTISAGGVFAPFALGLTAFLAVFREGAETIFFYQVLISDAYNQQSSIWLGALIGVVALSFIYWLTRILSFRLPIRLFFNVTAVFLAIMSFSFVGKGILELQMVGMIEKTMLSGDFMVASLGIFPNIQTLSGQLCVMIIVVTVFIWDRLTAQKQRVQ